MSEGSLTEILKRMDNIVSLEQIWADDFKLEDFVPDDDFRVFDEAVKEIMNDDLKTAFKILDKRERYVLTKRFGLDGKKPQNLENIGNTLHLSRERVRQIERDALERLRNNPATQHLEFYL